MQGANPGAGSQIASRRRVCLTPDDRTASAVKHEQGSHPHMKRDAALSTMRANKRLRLIKRAMLLDQIVKDLLVVFGPFLLSTMIADIILNDPIAVPDGFERR
jgi:hypothetical protein